MVQWLDCVIFASVINETETFLILIVGTGFVMTLPTVDNSFLEPPRLDILLSALPRGLN